MVEVIPNLIFRSSNLFLDFNTPAIMARQGGRVPLKQSDILLALTIAKIDTGGFLHPAIEDKQYLIKKPYAEGQ